MNFSFSHSWQNVSNKIIRLTNILSPFKQNKFTNRFCIYVELRTHLTFSLFVFLEYFQQQETKPELYYNDIKVFQSISVANLVFSCVTADWLTWTQLFNGFTNTQEMWEKSEHTLFKTCQVMQKSYYHNISHHLCFFIIEKHLTAKTYLLFHFSHKTNHISTVCEVHITY